LKLEKEEQFAKDNEERKALGKKPMKWIGDEDAGA
jgi:hypothetical protein